MGNQSGRRAKGQGTREREREREPLYEYKSSLTKSIFGKVLFFPRRLTWLLRIIFLSFLLQKLCSFIWFYYRWWGGGRRRVEGQNLGGRKKKGERSRGKSGRGESTEKKMGLPNEKLQILRIQWKRKNSHNEPKDDFEFKFLKWKKLMPGPFFFVPYFQVFFPPLITGFFFCSFKKGNGNLGLYNFEIRIVEGWIGLKFALFCSVSRCPGILNFYWLIKAFSFCFEVNWLFQNVRFYHFNNFNY